jgi:hypothetical protein
MLQQSRSLYKNTTCDQIKVACELFKFNCNKKEIVWPPFLQEPQITDCACQVDGIVGRDITELLPCLRRDKRLTVALMRDEGADDQDPRTGTGLSMPVSASEG